MNTIDKNEIINSYLNRLLELDPVPQYRGSYFEYTVKIDRKIYEPIIQELLHEKIISKFSETNDKIILTTPGREIAKIGYINWLTNQEKLSLKKAKKEQDLYDATIQASRATVTANRATLVSVIVGVLSFLYSIYQFNQNAIKDTQIESLNARISSVENKYANLLQNQQKNLIKSHSLQPFRESKTK
jgi:hypothetical protein